jgi:hypothetical protein
MLRDGHLTTVLTKREFLEQIGNAFARGDEARLDATIWTH